MKKITALLLILAIACGLCACGSKQSAPVSEVYAKMIADVQFPTEMLKMDDDFFVNTFGFELGNFEEYVFAKGEDVLLAENIIIIKVKDGQDVNAIKTKLEKFVTEQTAVFSSYVPEQSKVAEKSVVAVKGNYVYMLMSSKVAELKKIAADMI